MMDGAAHSAESIVTSSAEAMATTFRVSIAGMSALAARQAAAAAFAEIARLERLLSRYVDGSDVDRINRAPADCLVRVSADTLDCLDVALTASRMTHGAFDPTLGQLTAGHSSPAESFGHALLHLERRTLAVRKDHARMCLDLGGVGKGFALDRAADVLREWDVPAFLLDAGGSTVLAFDPASSEGRWTGRLDRPGGSREIQLRRSALAASGTTVKGSHILDGRTGRCADFARRVWALADTAALADALSTAFFTMPWEEIAILCETNPGLGAACVESVESADAGFHATGELAARLA